VVTDVTGRVILENNVGALRNGNAVSINTSRFARGCYFFNLVSEKKTASLRWIKE
jgi:hypothetical protein